MAALDFQDPANSQYLALLVRGAYAVPSTDPFDAVSAVDTMTVNLSKAITDTVTTADSQTNDAGGYIPQLNFSDPRNSQYLALILLGRTFTDSVTALDAAPTKDLRKVVDDSVVVGDVVPMQDYVPSLNFTEPRNSQYLPLILLGVVPTPDWFVDHVHVTDTVEPNLGRDLVDVVVVTDDPAVRLDRELVLEAADTVEALEQLRPHIYTNSVRPLITKPPLLSTAFARPADIVARVSRTLGRHHATAPADYLQPEDAVHVVISATQRTDTVGVFDTVAKHLTTAAGPDIATPTDVLTELNLYPPKPIDPVAASDAMTRNVGKVASDTVAVSDALVMDVQKVLTDAPTVADNVIVGRIDFIGISTREAVSASETVSLPVGAAAGDMCHIFVEFSAAAVTSTSGWSTTSRTWWYDSSVFWKKLSSTDITNGSVTLGTLNSASAITLVVHRGVTTSVLKTDEGTSSSAGTTIALTGYTKAVGCRGILTAVSDRDPDSAPTPPAGFASRGGQHATYFTQAIADLVDPSAYTNGAALTWAGMQGTSDYAQHGYVFELT